MNEFKLKYKLINNYNMYTAILFDRIDKLEQKILEVEQYIMSMNNKLVGYDKSGNKKADVLNNHFKIVEKKHTSTKSGKKTKSKTKTKKRGA